MIVYLDVLLLENFLINFFLIVVTMQLSSNKLRYRMVVLSSVMGSFYTLMIFFDKLSIFTNIISKFLVVVLMIKIVLWSKGYLQVLKVSIIFFVTSIAFSGFCFFFAMAENSYNIAGAFTIENYSSKSLLFSTMILYLTSYRIYVYMKGRNISKNFIYDLEFNFKGNKIVTKGFLDTGNELVEPATMLPVIILERRICNFYIIDEKEAFNIPYKLVNGTSSAMKGIKVKDIIIKSNGLDARSIDAVIALCDTRLSQDDDYNALLSRAIL